MKWSDSIKLNTSDDNYQRTLLLRTNIKIPFILHLQTWPLSESFLENHSVLRHLETIGRTNVSELFPLVNLCENCRLWTLFLCSWKWYQHLRLICGFVSEENNSSNSRFRFVIRIDDCAELVAGHFGGHFRARHFVSCEKCGNFLNFHETEPLTCSARLYFINSNCCRLKKKNKLYFISEWSSLLCRIYTVVW